MDSITWKSYITNEFYVNFFFYFWLKLFCTFWCYNFWQVKPIIWLYPTEILNKTCIFYITHVSIFIIFSIVLARLPLFSFIFNFSILPWSLFLKQKRATIWFYSLFLILHFFFERQRERMHEWVGEGQRETDNLK